MKNLIKKIYLIFPFKKQIFLFIRYFWTPSENIFKHLYFKGNFKVSINKYKSFKIRHYGYFIENEIFWTGLANVWEKESLKIWMKLCETSDVIIDIGANTGVYSLIAKTINNNSKVYAFEPVKRIFSKLQDNISLNKFDIISIEKAVSNSDGNAIIYDTNSEHIYSVTVNKNLSDTGIKVFETKIETVTLNSFIKEYNLLKIDLIKIDVETHEAEVLEGFNEYISVFRPSILIEILNDEVGQKVNNLVSNLDYLYFNVDEKKGVMQVDKIKKSDNYNYLLCEKRKAVELGLFIEEGEF
ncbi:MAG: methyltransferase [Bacteroidetes bacterium GWA2_30_7]|nr:MAG: methyltransferase [Bacteroidetes bacterium GWA2_30_7]